MKKFLIVALLLLLLIFIHLSGCVFTDGGPKKDTVYTGLDTVYYEVYVINRTQDLPEDSYLLLPMFKQNHVIYNIERDDFTYYDGNETEPSSASPDFNVSDELTDYGRVVRISPIQCNRRFIATYNEVYYDLNVEHPEKSNRLPIFSTQDDLKSDAWVYSSHKVDSFVLRLWYEEGIRIAISADLEPGWNQYRVYDWSGPTT